MEIRRTFSQRFRKSLRAEESGNVAITFALLAPIVTGLGGSTVDFLHWTKQRDELQDVADSAALAATRQLTYARIPDGATRQAKAKEQANAFIDAHRPQARRTVEVELKTNTVKVNLAEDGLVAFSSLFGVSGVEVGAASTAIAGIVPERVCLLGLDPAATAGVEISGTVTFEGRSCSIRSNAESDHSLRLDGNVKVTGERICAAGTATINGGSATVSPMPESLCVPVPDPFEKWTGPTVGACHYNDFNAKNKDTVVLEPGVYCGGMDLSGTGDVTFKPGTYIVKDGSLKMTAKRSVVGERVGIYLHGNGAILDISGQASLKLTAQLSGPMAGLVIAQSRTSVTTATFSKLTGGSTLFLEGTIYLPRQDLELGGNAEVAIPKVTQIIGRTVKLSGTSKMVMGVDFEGAGLPPIAVKATKLRITN